MGRYYGLQINERKCKLCKNGIEDEIHFLLQCPKITSVRTNILNEIGQKFINFKNMNDEAKFIWLMSSEDSFIIKKMCSLLQYLYEKRSSILLDIT